MWRMWRPSSYEPKTLQGKARWPAVRGFLRGLAAFRRAESAFGFAAAPDGGNDFFCVHGIYSGIMRRCLPNFSVCFPAWPIWRSAC